MGKSRRSFADPGVRGRDPASAARVRLRTQPFVGQSFLSFTELLLRSESIVSVYYLG